MKPRVQLLHRGWKLRHPHHSEMDSGAGAGCVHTDLHRAKLIPDPFWSDSEKKLQWIEEEDWTYTMAFTVDSSPAETRRDRPRRGGARHAGGDPAQRAGDPRGRSRCSRAGVFPVKKFLKPGRQRADGGLRESDEGDPGADQAGSLSRVERSGGRCPRCCGKSSARLGGTGLRGFATSGIWLPIFLEGWNTNRIESLHVAAGRTTGGARAG